MKSKIIIPALAISVASATFISCNRFLDVVPTDRVIPKTAEDFRGMLTTVYGVYPSHKALVNLRTDELKTTSTSETLKAIFTWNDTNPTVGSTEYPYASFYQSIFNTNYIIENATKNVTPGAEINQILGEAYAMRALNYFELVNLYAPVYNGSNGNSAAVLLVTAIDLEGNFPKATLDEVYKQIFDDITKAETLLNVETFENGLNYRFTKTALSALRARIHQYRGEWNEALKFANDVLAKKSDLEDFAAFSVMPCSFKSKEAIMNLDFNVNGTTNSFSKVSDEHLALFDQTNDLRFAKYFKKSGSNWVTTKYNSNNEFKCTFRTGEMLLIKAEALAKLNQEDASKQVVLSLAAQRYNAVGFTAFQNKVAILSGTTYYTELLNERARETSYEGLRWFDLRRTTQPEIRHIFDGSPYILKAKDERYTLTFPKEARLKNPFL